ncbi:MAG: GNAT family N-acetyltransferase [Gemmatimonadetes bacterium]|jgi:ribosomal protein S18 acetylase RimI-like enzyme|nr:GNAT family N-acetyltransferase [Gemmatimonadota bacterium]
MTDLNTIRIRAATPADSEFAYMVKEAAFRVYVEHIKTWDEADQRRQHLRRFAEQEFHVIERGLARIGVVAMVVHDNHVKLNQLMIHPDHQDAGVGAQCLRWILDRAHGLGLPVRLQCMKVNPRSVAFYERHGFRIVDEGETHYTMLSTCG